MYPHKKGVSHKSYKISHKLNKTKRKRQPISQSSPAPSKQTNIMGKADIGRKSPDIYLNSWRDSFSNAPI